MDDPAPGSRTSHVYFLREVSDPDTDEFILVVKASAGWHKANVLSVAREHVADLPSTLQSGSNPVEHVWESWSS